MSQQAALAQLVHTSAYTSQLNELYIRGLRARKPIYNLH